MDLDEGKVRHSYPAGKSRGPFPLLDWEFPPQYELYVRGRIRVSNPWHYHPSTVNKLIFIGTNESDRVDNEIVIALKGSGPDNAQIRGIAQAPVQGDYLTANKGRPGFSLGDWHVIEVQVIRNTGGRANGVMRWWVDGTLVGEHFGVVYKTAGDGYFNRVGWQHYWGGNASIKNQTDYIWDDELYLSGRPLGR